MLHMRVPYIIVTLSQKKIIEKDLEIKQQKNKGIPAI